MSYIFLKSIIIEIAKRQHLGIVEVLVFSKYSVSSLGWFSSTNFPKNLKKFENFISPSFLLIPPPKLQNGFSSIPFEIVRLLLRCWHINKATQKIFFHKSDTIILTLETLMKGINTKVTRYVKYKCFLFYFPFHFISLLISLRLFLLLFLFFVSFFLFLQ